MQFRNRGLASAAQQKRARRRVLMLCGMLGLVLIGINQAADPETWVRFLGLPREEQALPELEPEPEGPAPEGRDELAPDAFRIAEAKPPMPVATGARSANEPWKLPPDLLAEVRDDSLNIRKGENTAYFSLLKHARDLPQEMLEQHARRNRTYAQLHAEPEKYRGELVTLQGRLRRLQPLGYLPNDQGIQFVYEAWFFTADSNLSPIVFRCTSIPEGMPFGDKLSETVRVTGYFFKRYQYVTPRRLYSAPMIVGKRLVWIPAPTVRQADPESIPYILGIVGGIGLLCAGGACWLVWNGGKRRKLPGLAPPEQPIRETLESLQQLDLKDVREQLKELAEEPEPTAADQG